VKTFLKYLFLVTAIAGFAVIVHATPMLMVGVGSNSLHIADGSATAGAVDTNLTAGVIDWTGTMTGWNINFQQGLTGGSVESPELTLTFDATSLSDSSGPLWLYFTYDNLGPTTNGSAVTTITGHASGTGTVNYWATLNSGATWSTLNSGGPFRGLSFYDSSTSALFSSDGYTLKETIKITNPGSDQSVSGVLTLIDPPKAVPDSGTTLLLLGAGLTGLGLVSRLRKRFNKA